MCVKVFYKFNNSFPTRTSITEPAATLRLFDRVHPKSLSLYPGNRNLFLAGNSKGGCFIFDLRNAVKRLVLVLIYICSPL